MQCKTFTRCRCHGCNSKENATTHTSANSKRNKEAIIYLNGLILDGHSNLASDLFATRLAALETKPGVNHTIMDLGGLEAYLTQESLGWFSRVNFVSARVIYGNRYLLVGPDNIAMLIKIIVRLGSRRIGE